VQAGLAELGYSQEEIEGEFIPIMLLRRGFDVGHVTIKLYKPEELEAFYKYLEDIEFKFRDLLRGILDRVQAGTYEIRQEGDLLPDRKKRREIEKLIGSFEKVKKK